MPVPQRPMANYNVIRYAAPSTRRQTGRSDAATPRLGARPFQVIFVIRSAIGSLACQYVLTRLS